MKKLLIGLVIVAIASHLALSLVSDAIGPLNAEASAQVAAILDN